MSVSHEPRLKIIRRLGTSLPGLTRKSAERRPYPPGQHGQTSGRKRSAYRIQLEEKQKLRFNYGVSERQLRRYYRIAVAKKGSTGENLLILLESRLDNVVFRAGFAPTIPSARQLVGHGHVTVNGRRVNVANYLVEPGDVVAIRAASQKIPTVASTVQSPSLTPPVYLDVDTARFSATCKTRPQRSDVPFPLEDNLVIEFYARMA